jgi:hypothetical protein
MLYREIIAVCSQIHTKHINTLCGQNVECRTYRAVNTLRLSFCLPARPSSRNNSAPIARIFMKFCMWAFFENLSRKCKFP